MACGRQICVVLFLCVWAVFLVSPSPYEWMARDKWDIVNEKFSNVSASNCRSKSKYDLELGGDIIAGVPEYNKIRKSRIFSNRSQLLHVHNMALNRAFFYSFIFQRVNQSWDFETQPGLMYIYLSAAADVSANDGWINGSALWFDNNCTYPNWYTTVPMNTTLPLFAPRSWREDDYNEPTNFLREPTNSTIDVWDMATGHSRNYTHISYKGNPMYTTWLPDLPPKDDEQQKDSSRKATYRVAIKSSNVTGRFLHDSFENFNFFGPPQPKSSDLEVMLPVRFTKPYFDCGKSNRWIVTASSPLVDYMPRYLNYTHRRFSRFVGIATMDIEFERIDMNQCPLSLGNTKNYFAGTARCRPTTMCESLSGFGFRRGGYICVCRPGHYYPWWHDGPFLGVELEQATKEEWEVGFDCLTVEDRRVIATEWPTFVRKKRSVASAKDFFLSITVPENVSPRLTKHKKAAFISTMKSLTESLKRQRREAKDVNPHVRVKRKLKSSHKPPQSQTHHRSKRDTVDEHAVNRMNKILLRYGQTTDKTCKDKKPYELFLPGDAAYGVQKQFEGQGRTALRLAHFLSAFLQNVDEYEEFGNLKGDRRLNETQIYGEVMATVMADFKILGAGVYFDRYKFRMSPPVNNTDPRLDSGITREFFGPYSWRIKEKGDGAIAGAAGFRAMDFAGMDSYYTDTRWFSNMKARWATNFVELKKYSAKPMIRSDFNGTSQVRFEFYPMTYRAPKYMDGEWLRPEFKCDGRVDSWVVTYLAPFFGKDDIKQDIEFKGVVAVEVDLSELVIDQCPGPFHVANAFKNTARCHYESQYCFATEGEGYTSGMFRTGFYKCECRQGFEYPINDMTWYFDGQGMEKEYKKMVMGEGNKFETLRCRIAGASAVPVSIWLISVVTLASALFNKL